MGTIETTVRVKAKVEIEFNASIRVDTHDESSVGLGKDYYDIDEVYFQISDRLDEILDEIEAKVPAVKSIDQTDEEYKWSEIEE